MATKKQKRILGLAKHEQFMEEYRAEGLKALQRDKARRFKAKLEEWQKIHTEKHFKFVQECPHCQVIKAAGRKEKLSAAS